MIDSLIPVVYRDLHQAVRSEALKAQAADPAHDLAHCERVLVNALVICEQEGGNPAVQIAAAYLHDIANLPKNHPDSRLSSEHSAQHARRLLEGLPIFSRSLGGKPGEKKESDLGSVLDSVHDAILCHSYSRGLDPGTLDGRIFQDADRLDGIGAIGIARVFTVGGALSRPLYEPQDPFAEYGREANDRTNSLDHFFCKLLKIQNSMKTPTGLRLAQERTETMRWFLERLQGEITAPHLRD